MALVTTKENPNFKAQYLVVFTYNQCQEVAGVSPCTAFRRHTGTAASAAARSITLDGGASASDDIYNRMTVRITANTGVGQERKILDYVGSTKVGVITEPWTITPDGTSTFDIINRPQACFNTRHTCEDLPNYNQGEREEKHCMKDRALPFKGETLLPDLMSVPKYRPGKIDPRKGKLENSSTTMRFADLPFNDVGLDPYRKDRSYDPLDQGSFWTKANARDPHYNGRKAEVKRGVQGDTESDMQVSRNVIEQRNIRNNEVLVTIKDMLKVTDKVQLPIPSAGVLDGAVTAGDATISLDDASDYLDPVATGRKEYVAIDENVIRYTGISSNDLTGCTWQKFGTTQANADDGAKVQQCWGYEGTNVADMIHDCLNDSGIVDGDIDVTLLESERDTWLLSAVFTGVHVKPKKARQILQELMFQGMCNVYWDEVDQKVKLKVTAPPSPLDTIMALTDKDIIKPGVDVDNNEESRLSRVTVWFNKRSAFDDDNKWESYVSGYRTWDKVAEGPLEYGEPATEDIFSRWISTSPWAARIANRLWSRFKDRAALLAFTVPVRHSTIAPGDIIELTTKKFIDKFGAPLQNRQVQIISRKQASEINFEYVALDTSWAPGGTSGGRYAFISPSGYPDYDDATTEQRKYGFIGTTVGNTVGVDEDPGYYIF